MGSHINAIDMLDIEGLAAQNINTTQLIGGISENDLIGFSEVFDELSGEDYDENLWSEGE